MRPKIEVEWKDSPGGEIALVGSRTVGKWFYNGMRPKGSPQMFRATCALPGMDNVLGDHLSAGNAKAAVVSAVLAWFNGALGDPASTPETREEIERDSLIWENYDRYDWQLFYGVGHDIIRLHVWFDGGSAWFWSLTVAGETEKVFGPTRGESDAKRTAIRALLRLIKVGEGVSVDAKRY